MTVLLLLLEFLSAEILFNGFLEELYKFSCGVDDDDDDEEEEEEETALGKGVSTTI